MAIRVFLLLLVLVSPWSAQVLPESVDMDYPDHTFNDADRELCGGAVSDLTPEFNFALFAYEFTPLGPIELVEESVQRVTSQSYRESESGVAQASREVSLDSYTKQRITRRSYSYIDENGELRTYDINCNFKCTGSACDLSGCTPNASGCSSFVCKGSSATYPCSGTCSQSTGSSRPESANKN